LYVTSDDKENVTKLKESVMSLNSIILSYVVIFAL